jgi:hypothetical protein
MTAKKKGNPKTKATAKKRTVNPPGGAPRVDQGSPFNEQDVKRRLGGFTTTGEHSLVGGRHGIIGQTKKKFATDKKKPKK